MNKPWFWLLLVAMLCSTSVTLTLLLTQQDYVRDALWLTVPWSFSPPPAPACTIISQGVRLPQFEIIHVDVDGNEVEAE